MQATAEMLNDAVAEPQNIRYEPTISDVSPSIIPAMYGVTSATMPSTVPFDEADLSSHPDVTALHNAGHTAVPTAAVCAYNVLKIHA